MITHRQIKAARAMLGISQIQLGQLAGVSPPRIWAIERGADHLQSTANAIRTALESKGAMFGVDGSVNVRRKADDPFILGPGNPDAATVRAAMAIVAAAKKARTPLP